MNSSQPLELPSGTLTAAAVLIGAGALLGAAGLLLGSGAAIVTIRRWVQGLDEPPRDIARRRWHQVSNSVAAGAQAWRGGQSPG